MALDLMLELKGVMRFQSDMHAVATCAQSEPAHGVA